MQFCRLGLVLFRWKPIGVLPLHFCAACFLWFTWCSNAPFLGDPVKLCWPSSEPSVASLKLVVTAQAPGNWRLHWFLSLILPRLRLEGHLHTAGLTPTHLLVCHTCNQVLSSFQKVIKHFVTQTHNSKGISHPHRTFKLSYPESSVVKPANFISGIQSSKKCFKDLKIQHFKKGEKNWLYCFREHLRNGGSNHRIGCFRA